MTASDGPRPPFAYARGSVGARGSMTARESVMSTESRPFPSAFERQPVERMQSLPPSLGRSPATGFRSPPLETRGPLDISQTPMSMSRGPTMSMSQAPVSQSAMLSSASVPQMPQSYGGYGGYPAMPSDGGSYGAQGASMPTLNFQQQQQQSMPASMFSPGMDRRPFTSPNMMTRDFGGGSMMGSYSLSGHPPPSTSMAY